MARAWLAQELATARDLAAQGWSCARIGRQIGRSRSAVDRRLRYVPRSSVRAERTERLAALKRRLRQCALDAGVRRRIERKEMAA